MLNYMNTIIGYLCTSFYYQEQLILYSHAAVYIIHSVSDQQVRYSDSS